MAKKARKDRLPEDRGGGAGKSRACLACGGAMEIGFIVEFDKGIGTQIHWHAGVPKLPQVLDMSTAKKATTYRCQNCGYLQSYAS